MGKALAQGRLFTPAARPAALTAGPPGTCFATASRMADGHADLLYVEGMVLADGMPFAFDHAWCVNAASAGLGTRSGSLPALTVGDIRTLVDFDGRLLTVSFRNKGGTEEMLPLP
ncbi:hypothetical protein ACFQ0B_48080 [Nonomuraea thailandensis]